MNNIIFLKDSQSHTCNVIVFDSKWDVLVKIKRKKKILTSQRVHKALKILENTSRQL